MRNKDENQNKSATKSLLDLLYIQIMRFIRYTNEFRFSVGFECYENRCQN